MPAFEICSERIFNFLTGENFAQKKREHKQSLRAPTKWKIQLYFFSVCVHCEREQTKMFEMGRYVMAINFEPNSKHQSVKTIND